MADLAGGEDNSIEESESEIPAEDVTLRSMFNQDGEEAEPEFTDEAVTEPPAPPPPPNIDSSKLADLEAKLAEVNDKLVASTTTQNILRMQMEQQNAPIYDDNAPEEVDFDALNKEIQANPAKAILDTVNKAFDRVQQRLEDSTTRKVADMSSHQRMFDNDKGRATQEFGELLRTDKEFVRRAEEAYAEITSNAPVVDARGNKWSPGAIYSAMSVAYAEFVRQGKIKLPGNSSVLSERKKPPMSSLLGDGQSPGVSSALSGYNAREISVMKRTASQLGVPFDSYVKRLEKLKKNDSSFGG